MTNNLVYKVCYVHEGRYYSLNAGSIEPVLFNQMPTEKSPFIIEYKVGEWAEPKVPGSALLAFAFSSIAKNHHNTMTCLLECEYKPFPHWPKSRLPIDEVLTDVQFTKDFWEMRKWGPQYGPSWPDGTAFCSAIKPLRIL